MGKTRKIRVKCPNSECGFEQYYHSYSKTSELKGERRMNCKRCGTSFKVLDQRIEKMHKTQKKDDRPFGWQKFSKN